MAVRARLSPGAAPPAAGTSPGPHLPGEPADETHTPPAAGAAEGLRGLVASEVVLDRLALGWGFFFVCVCGFLGFIF